MEPVKVFIKEFTTEEAAIDFADKVGGTVNNTAVKFRASYSLSKARYSVKNDKYAVYLRIAPEATVGDFKLSVVIYADTSVKAYQKAREKAESGVI